LNSEFGGLNIVATMTVTPDRDAIISEIYIAASPERVFQALVDPQQVVQWWGRREFIAALSSKEIRDRALTGAAQATAATVVNSPWRASISKSMPRAC
jgi:hypothetical protein